MPEIFAGRHLVTASALLDLVSRQWLRAPAFRCRAVGASALFTIKRRPVLVRACRARRHGSRSPQPPPAQDKGLGGLAADRRGRTRRAVLPSLAIASDQSSDWNLGSTERDLQRALIEGWAQAALE